MSSLFSEFLSLVEQLIGVIRTVISCAILTVIICSIAIAYFVTSRNIQRYYPNINSPDCKCNPHEKKWWSISRSSDIDNMCENKHCVAVVISKTAHFIRHASDPIYIEMHDLKNSLIFQCILRTVRSLHGRYVCLLLDPSAVVGKKNRLKLQQLREASKQ